MACKRSGVRIPIAPQLFRRSVRSNSLAGSQTGSQWSSDFAALLVVSVVWLKMAFIVVAPVLITGLSW